MKKYSEYTVLKREKEKMLSESQSLLYTRKSGDPRVHRYVVYAYMQSISVSLMEENLCHPSSVGRFYDGSSELAVPRPFFSQHAMVFSMGASLTWDFFNFGWV